MTDTWECKYTFKSPFIGYLQGGSSRDSQSSSSTTTKKVLRGIPAVLTAKAVFMTATTRIPGINCFADLNNPEEEFFIKSYNTSSIYNLMYEERTIPIMDCKTK